MQVVESIITVEQGIEYINLLGSNVETQYNGQGNALLIVQKGEPKKLIYEEANSFLCSEEGLRKTFESNGLAYEELNPKNDEILIGHCDGFRFCFPFPIYGRNVPVDPF
ncbi:hypothetical protein [Halobacillus mangrovi]|uniref:Uncharacterized protein n=1 Tax=Halobacillus mangrovi TaxID=402384 RepID=A0A1W5ZYC3_9BACI|nr:hypothetical protein [Halobacillus mangrovi]ARI78241.1 hypothetical protein HM131_15890 [Halobacillus mangrovi]